MKFEEYLPESASGHRFSVTVSDPNHHMVSQRKEQILKHINVRHEPDKEAAAKRAHAFYKKQGYKVHSVEHHSELS